MHFNSGSLRVMETFQVKYLSTMYTFWRPHLNNPSNMHNVYTIDEHYILQSKLLPFILYFFHLKHALK